MVTRTWEHWVEVFTLLETCPAFIHGNIPSEEVDGKMPLTVFCSLPGGTSRPVLSSVLTSELQMSAGLESEKAGNVTHW
jgi:hypothetical protein